MTGFLSRRVWTGEPCSARRLFNRRTVAALAVLLVICVPAISGVPGASSTEYRIKAAFLYNFTSFVNWPEGTTGESGFTLCILGQDPFGTLLDNLAGKLVNNTPLIIKRIGRSEHLGQCRLLFIGETSTQQLRKTLSLLHDTPVLTVSDTTGFTELGGMIEFRVIANKVRFAINNKAAESAGLSISSKLLNLATHSRWDD